MNFRACVITKKFIDTAIACHPLEVCALVYNNQLVIVPNVSTTPRNSFKIHRLEMLKAYQSETGLQAVVHSHPHPHNKPSLADLACQSRLGCQFAIVTTDGHAVTDTYQWGTE